LFLTPGRLDEIVKKTNILITGPPGIGKTTLIKRSMESLGPFPSDGFITEEIRDGGVRKGFALVSRGGRRAILSHVDIRSRFRVGKYSVDVAAFDLFLDALDLAKPETRLVFIDEIGKMEGFSRKFDHLVRGLLDSSKVVLATIALQGGGLIAEVKERPDVEIIELSAKNREALAVEIPERLRAVLGDGV